jgi:hypothetical protein
LILVFLTLPLLFLATIATQHSTDYNKGYAHGVSDAKQAPNILAPVAADEIDCQDFPDHKPGAVVPEFCSGYEHGFADTINAAATIR